MDREKLQQMEKDPQFAALPYSEQVNLRTIAYQEILSKDRDFIALDDGQKELLFRKLVFKPPVFQNPVIGQRILENAEVYANYDPEDTEVLSLGTMGKVALEPEAAKRVRSAAFAQGMAQNSGVFQTIYKSVGNWAAKNFDLRDKDGLLLTYENLYGPDQRKGLEYYKYLASEDEQKAKTLSILEGAGTTTGFVTDLVSMYRATGGGLPTKLVDSIGNQIAKKIGVTALTKGSTAAAGQAARVGQWAFSSLIPTGARAIGEGIHWVLREKLSDVEGFDNSAENVLKTFGEGAAADFLLGTAISVGVPFLKLAGRVFFKGFGSKADDIASIAKKYKVGEEEVYTMMIERKVPEELLLTLNNKTQDSVRMGQSVIAAGKRMEDLPLRPIDKLYLDSSRLGVTLAQMNDGTFRFRDTADILRKYHVNPGKVDLDAHKILANIEEVQTELSKVAWRNYNMIDNADDQLDFLKKNAELLSYEKSRHSIRAAFNPVDSIADPAAKKRLQRSIERKNFIPANNRGAVHTSESAEIITKVREGGQYADRFNIAETDNIIKRVQKGNSPFKGGQSITLSKVSGSEPNALVVLRKPINMMKQSDAVVYSSAEGIAAKMLMKDADLGLDLSETTRMVLKKQGYDGIIHNSSQVESFFPTEVKYITDKVDLKTGGWAETLRKSSFESQGDLRLQAQIQSVVESKISSSAIRKNPKLLTQIAASKFSGELDPQDVRKFTRAYLSGTNAPVKNIKVNTGSDLIGVSTDGSQITIDIPRQILTQDQHQLFVSELLDGLQDVATSTESKGKIKTFDAYEEYSKVVNKYKSPLEGAENQIKWLDNIARSNLDGAITMTKDGKYAMQFPGMESPALYDNIEDLNDAVMLRTIDKGILKVDLHSKGYKLVEDNGVLLVKGKNNKVLYSGRDTKELLENMNYRPEKIDEVYAPKVVSFSDDHVTMSYVNGEVYSSRKKAYQLLDKFRDYSMFGRYAKRVADKSGDIYFTPKGLYKVYMPKAGIVEEFETIAEARKFLSKNWESNSNLRKLAQKKGLGFHQEGNVYKFYDGNNIYEAKSTSEIQKVFSQYPDIDAGPPLLTAEIEDLADEITQVVKPDPNGSMIDPPDFFSMYNSSGIEFEDMKPSIGTGNYLRKYFSNMDEFVRKVTKKTGDKELMRLYRDMETGFRSANTQINKAEDLIADLWTNVPGAKMTGRANLAKREAIFIAYQESDATKKAAILKKAGVSEQQGSFIMDRIGRFFGRNENEGLFAISRINANKFLNEYLPHIRKNVYRLDSRRINEMTALELCGESLQKSQDLPKEIRFWAEESRVSDIIELATERDPIVLMTKYADRMYKKLYMGDSWRSLNSYIHRNRSVIPDELIEQIQVYRDTVMSTYYSSSEKSVRKMGEEFSRQLQGYRNSVRKITGKDEIAIDPTMVKTHSDWTRRVFSLNYLVNMGFRTWLPFRNMFQIYTTLAPRMGFDNVNKAMKLVADGGDDIFEYLREVGIITGKAPIINSIADIDSKLAKVTSKGLSWFKNSDEMTRAVGAVTAKLQWDNAVSLARKGDIKNPEVFKVISGVNLIDPVAGDEIMRLFMSSTRNPQNADAALNIFQNRVVQDAFFGYRVSQSPQINRNFIGRLFGQYGTYSAGYRANLSRGLAYGTKAQKAAFIARTIAGSSAIYGAMRMIGIDEKSFLPFVPAVFTGGPMFNLALNGLRSLDVTSYRGKIARAEFTRDLQSLSPLNIVTRPLKRYAEFADKGEYWKAWLALTSAPVKRER